MLSRKGIVIEQVVPGSIADAAGLRPGDTVLSINAQPMHDVIDFMFSRDADELHVDFQREGAKKKVVILSDSGQDLGVTFKPLKVKVCKNNCIFCFVKQLPKGLRKPLYLKDEDYRLSFLYGNYTTLSNITADEKKRIVRQRLSPMYISVHSTNRSIRNKMLGNPKAADILSELKYFARHKIRMHIQIVLCPGYNDGPELKSTIQDVYRFYPYVSSIAVVPVGLTKQHRSELRPLTRQDALGALETVSTFQKRFRKKHGESIVYCADEMYIKAGIPFPSLQEYGELPQIENGVGMVPLFLSQSRKLKLPKTGSPKKRFLTITGTSFYPYLRKFADRLKDKESFSLDVVEVENRFFGNAVTVTGLITGRDIIATVHTNEDHYDYLIIPDVVLREGDALLLDDVSLADIEEAARLKVITTDGTPQGLINTMADSECRM